MNITAKENVNAWTTPTGDLTHGSGDDEIIYDAGSNTVFISGFFDADTLIEIAMHMKSTQK